jgi:hypothetical protein
MVNLRIILSLTPKPFKRELAFLAGIGTGGEDEGFRPIFAWSEG